MNSSLPVMLVSDAMPHLLGEPALILSFLQGEETISTLYTYTLTVKTPANPLISRHAAANLDVKSLIGKEMTVVIKLKTPDGHNAGKAIHYRELTGLVKQVRFVGLDIDRAVYEIVLRPWLDLATLTSDFRIFQHKSVTDIIQELLSEYAFPVVNRLSQSYPPLEYQVQYGESDFDFIQRLMEKWGIYWFFEHSDRAHRLVLVDHNGAHQPFPHTDYQSVRYSPHKPLNEENYISHFTTQEVLTSGRLVTSDFDFTKSRADIMAIDAKPHKTSFNDMEVYRWPGDYASLHTGEYLARIRMEELAATGFRAIGSGPLRTIACGTTFTLQDFPQEKANREYLSIGSSLEISAMPQRSGEPVYRFDCRFTAQPVNKVYRHPQLTPLPKAYGFQSAIVVGPQEEEIWTDCYGRVKVHFLWDRYGKYRESDSCWLRVNQSSAGNRFGSVYIPRIGQEVLVGFINGDPSRPIITGSLYNNYTMPPWLLPNNATQTGFITHTVGGGINNFNGIQFEDKPGEERFYEQAERDACRLIKNDETHQVGRDADLQVGNNRSLAVKGDYLSAVEGDHSSSVGQNRTLIIEGDQKNSVKGKMSLTVGNDKTVKVDGQYKTEVQGKISVATQDTLALSAKNALQLTSDGTLIIRAKIIQILADQQVTIDADSVFINP